MKQLVQACILLFGFSTLQAQMFVGPDTLYGNEWIDYTRTYYKINVAQDGIYRVNYAALSDAGIPAASVSGSEWQLYRNGGQVPLYVSTEDLFSDTDFIEFFGEKNRSELDQQLSDTPDNEIVNPWYSLFNDTAAYFLTWKPGIINARYTTVANDLTNLPQAEPYCWRTTTQVFSNAFLKREIGEEIKYSWFNGDGFTSGSTTAFSNNFQAAQVFTSGPPTASLRLRFAANRGQHTQQILLHDSLYLEENFTGWKVADQTFQVPINRLSTALSVKVNGTASPTDRNSVAGYIVRYPGTMLFPGTGLERFSLENGPGDRYLEIGSFNVSGGAPVLYDLTNRIRITTDISAGKVLAKLPPASGERFLALAAFSNGFTAVNTLQPVQFRDYSVNAEANFIIISNPALYADPLDNGANHVQEYADYRSSAAGGGYNVTIVDVKELYEQFAYGVRFHPIAIRNFAHFIKKTWTNPEFVLFIGKALDYNAFRSTASQNANVDKLFFVPMHGSPSVDQAFMTRRSGLSRPILATGRLAVTRPHQIRDYLDKLTEHEAAQRNSNQTIADKAWMKKVVHISGGLSPEAGLIRNYTKNMAEELKGNRFGADVSTFFKTSNDPVQTAAHEEIRTLMQNGVNIWTIFGHSSSTAVDYDIGDASYYQNSPRYPNMLLLGCNVGACSLPSEALGENYIFTPHSGGITFVASPYYGFIDALYSYAKRYYEHLGGDEYGQPIGKIIQSTTESLSSSSYSSLVAFTHQSVLQGDPALRLQVNTGADYVVNPATVIVNPNPVSTEAPNFDISFNIANIGENITAPITVKVEQQLPDNSKVTIVNDTIAAPALSAPLHYTIPNNNGKTGFHRFYITADSDNSVAEEPAGAEFNNEFVNFSGENGIEVYFFSNDVQPVFPPDFGIVPQQKVSLSASSLSSTNIPVRYLLQLDTLETFNSPYLRKTEIMQAGGLIQWPNDLNVPDSTVLYWRIAPDSLVNGEVPWRNRSFLYLSGSAPGWNQSDFGQYRRNDLSNFAAVDSLRAIDFVGNESYVMVKIDYADAAYFPGVNNGYYEGYLSGYQYGNMQNAYQGAIIMITDPISGKVIPNPIGGPYNPNPVQQQHYFYFATADSLQRIAMMEFMETQIPDKSAVAMLIFNRQNDQVGYAPELWANDSVSYGKNLFQVIESFGAKHIRELADYTGVPPAYGFVFQKNKVDFPPMDTLVTVAGDFAELRGDFPTLWFAGQMESGRIGPAKAWRSLHFQTGAADNPSDEHILTLWGERPGMPDTLLVTLDNAADTSLLAVSAASFPYLHIRYAALDTITRSAVPLHYARILFDPLPEGAVDPKAKFTFHNDTLQQGEYLVAELAFANISDAAFDTLLIQYRIENQTGDIQTVLQKMPPLAAGDTLNTHFTFNTKSLSGMQRLLIDINPDNNQPELYHFNNIAFRSFYVGRDMRNPLLNVTFDGSHIMDGDLISPQPEIILTLNDENPYLPLSDTTLFDIKLNPPVGDARIIKFSDPDILFIPASTGNLSQKNEARVEWRPSFLEDGDYHLSVQARDASNNASGMLEYGVSFKVINKSSISNLLNYPNPFSTSTCFYYTMTGIETPASFKLQIMTVSGKIVREVTEAEFGSLRAGVHQSQFCWDGRDEYGDQLANGVYLYRISARKADGTPFEFFENNSIDGFFKGGIGKMVLMR